MGEVHSKNVLICSSKERKFPSSKHCRSCSYKSEPLLPSKAFPKSKQGNRKYIFEKDFTVIRQVGSGAFANVFLAKSTSMNTTYAIKCIKKRPNEPSHKKTKLINNEKRILKSLQHPFIVKMHFSFQDENYFYLATDYLQNKDLHYHIAANASFTEEQAKFYLSEVYIAIKYLHSKGIIHRDLKSENVMLNDDGHIQIIDFGCAKRFPVESSHSALTNSFIGTAECMPPEAIKRQSYSFEFDWWSFGVLMYEMIYGCVPFRDVYQDAVLDLVLHYEPVYYKYLPHAEQSSTRVKVSNEAVDLMKRLLHKNPSNRIEPSSIPQHPFFSGVNLRDIESGNVEPPRLPSMTYSKFHSKQLM